MKHLKNLFWIGGVALLAAGCASAPSHFYTLNPMATTGATPETAYSVIVGPVFVPTAVDRPQIVVATTTNQVAIEEFNRWDAPLPDTIARAVSGNLRVLLGTPRVTIAPMPDFGPAYRVTIRVDQFKSVLGTEKQSGEAVVEAVWAIRDPAGGKVTSGTTSAHVPVQGSDFETLAAAHSCALLKVSSDIASAIQAVAGEKP